MKTENFENSKPTSSHSVFMKDFCAGYDSVIEKLNRYSVEQLINEFNAANPTGSKPSSMAAYFYAKGEMAAILDNK